MYKTILKHYLRHHSPSGAFKIAADVLSAVRKIPFGRSIVRMRYKNRIRQDGKLEVFGLEFSNPVGLAAYIDTEGILYNSLSDFGFSFVEIGPLTFVEQDLRTAPGHYLGVKKAVEHLQTDRPDCIIAGNIARHPQNRGADMIADYEKAFALLYDFVDIIVINPLCGEDGADGIAGLPDIIDRVLTMRLYYDANKPVLVSLTPDLTLSQTDELIDCCLSSGIDGVVAGSTMRRDDDGDGSILFNKNLKFISHIREKSSGLLPIIGVGGVMDSVRAQQMLDAGASLIEVYTGFFREGPSIVKDIVNNLRTAKEGARITEGHKKLTTES